VQEALALGPLRFIFLRQRENLFLAKSVQSTRSGPEMLGSFDNIWWSLRDLASENESQNKSIWNTKISNFDGADKEACSNRYVQS
jgi:hypothetical protein